MAYATHCNSIIREEFFKPLFEDFATARRRRSCPALHDALWLESGIRRCLGSSQSGRDFLQQLAEQHDSPVRVSTFFESLKSERRLALLNELLQHSCKRMRRVMPDAFSGFQCLDDFDLYAGDGHFIAAASHDKAVARKGKGKGQPALTTDPAAARSKVTKYATGNIYTLNLRIHAASHLSVADQVERNKEHEMRTLKRQTAETLRQGAAKGRKVLYVWDRAGIDFRQWHLWKSQHGIYFLSREKDNMKLEVLGEHPFDQAAALNAGVIADEMVSTSVGVSVRRVTYQDPESGVIYCYLTNLPASIPPGIVALLYKARWDIEKVFDEFKNKLLEAKAWASSATAKTNQARLLCLTHNLLTIFEQEIRARCGVDNQAELRRKSNEIRKREQAVRAGSSQAGPPRPQNPPLSIAAYAFTRFTQRSVKFIRWLRNHLDLQRDWNQAIARLARIYAFS
jgi:hypothetical protein